MSEKLLPKPRFSRRLLLRDFLCDFNPQETWDIRHEILSAWDQAEAALAAVTKERDEAVRFCDAMTDILDEVAYKGEAPVADSAKMRELDRVFKAACDWLPAHRKEGT